MCILAVTVFVQVARPYKKPEMAETVLQGSSRNLISGGLISA